MSERTKSENKAVMAEHLIEQYKARAASELAVAAGSAGHRICRNCKHRWPQLGAPPYHQDSWCHMFRSGEHVDAQGYCGQFRLPMTPPNGPSSPTGQEGRQ